MNKKLLFPLSLILVIMLYFSVLDANHGQRRWRRVNHPNSHQGSGACYRHRAIHLVHQR